MTKLDGKVALVTGAGRGIGRAIALKLAREGARVVVNDLDDEPAAETVAAIAAGGGAATSCNGSVVEAGFAERFVQTALDRFGGLDIIVNNAGFTRDNVIQKMTDEQFQAVLDVHVTAPFRILRAAAEPIRRFAKQEAEEGREVYRKVVNISSVSGLCGNAGQINYAAGKAAVVGMTKTLAKEWGRYRVNVNCVAFGFIATRMTEPLGEARLEALAKQQVPLGRLGTVEEAANGVYLFCTPESDYISGQIITVGGGIRF
jgi:3-oxoacyl-[acyl-carrier protein] reductase